MNFFVAEDDEGRANMVFYAGISGRTPVHGALYLLSEEAVEAGYEIIGLTVINTTSQNVVIGPGPGDEPVYHIVTIQGQVRFVPAQGGPSGDDDGDDDDGPGNNGNNGNRDFSHGNDK